MEQVNNQKAKAKHTIQILKLGIEDVDSVLSETIAILKNGGVVVAPSDTVYGLLVDATNTDAINKLFELKDRPVGKAVSVFVSGLPMMDRYVDTSKLTQSTRSILPGPYTLVLPSRGVLPRTLEAEDGTLGMRFIGNSKYETHTSGEVMKKKGNENTKEYISPADFVTTLVAQYGSPVTATSANLSGKSVCRSPSAFLRQLSQKRVGLVDLIIDAGELPFAHPSTVLHLAHDQPTVLRSSFRNFAKTDVHPSRNVAETGEIAIQLLHDLKSRHPANKAAVILLHGELGAGKTTFVQSLAKKLGISDVGSPTFIYECEYDISNDLFSRLHHYDLYNIADAASLEALQIEKNLSAGKLVCIEWSEKLSLKEQEKMNTSAIVYDVTIQYEGESQRHIRISHNLL